jgi:hypothetical protein
MFDPIRICEVLNDEGVDYVIVGGFADSKRAANRPKDIMALPYLESLRDEIAQRRTRRSD